MPHMDSTDTKGHLSSHRSLLDAAADSPVRRMHWAQDMLALRSPSPSICPPPRPLGDKISTCTHASLPLEGAPIRSP